MLKDHWTIGPLAVPKAEPSSVFLKLTTFRYCKGKKGDVKCMIYQEGVSIVDSLFPFGTGQDEIRTADGLAIRTAEAPIAEYLFK